MTDQPTHLSIIELYASERHMTRDDLVVTLMKTIMPKGKDGQDLATKADMIAFLQIARRFDLDPWAREIFCIMSKGKIQPYISVDGYAKIVNRQPEYDGCEFDYQQNADGQFMAVTCSMFRKDRSRATRVTEFMSECFKPDSEAWRKNPARMLRHRAFVQAARLTFGVTGALDEDAADQTIIDVTPIEERDEKKPEPPRAPAANKAPPSPTQQNGNQTQQEPDKGHPPVEVEGFMNDLNDRLNEAKNVEQLREIWVELNPAMVLSGNEQMTIYAQGIYDKLEAKLKEAK